MKYIGALFFVFASTLISSCANDLQGASMYIMQGGYYVERWYLNPEYNRRDIPTGTAFYGAAAEKLKDKFIVKYYIYDGKKSDVEIPRTDLWVVNHNGKGRNEQDDDNFFYYNKNSLGLYEKYKIGDYYQIVVEERPLAIKSCDNEGWCKIYPNEAYDFKDIYVKKIILKEPLQSESSN